MTKQTWVTRCLDEIRARWELGELIFNYELDPVLEELLLRSMSSGILEIDFLDGYFWNITFGNAVKMRMWNANRYYAWLSCGKIGGSAWGDGRPSAKTMVALRNMIMAHLRDAVGGLQ